MKLRTPSLLLPLLFFAAHSMYGQGCSDAGFCTLNALKNNGSNDHKEDHKNQMEAGISHGSGDNEIEVTSFHLEYIRQISSTWSLNAKVLFLSANGELSSEHDLSDVFITGIFAPAPTYKFTFGIKAPFNNGNKMANGLPLPMGYQTSLGTFDVIAGFQYALKAVGISAAIQQPLTQNENGFLPSLYPTGSEAYNYPSTRNFTRKGDALIRINYDLRFSKEKFKITPGLLFIYHLGKDTYNNESGTEVTINGSEGLTLNATLLMEYSLNKTNTLELNFGSPFITRDARPDGLTRKYVAGIEYKITF